MIGDFRNEGQESNVPRFVVFLAAASLALCGAAASATGGVIAPAAELSVVPSSAQPGRRADTSIDLTLSTRSPAPARVVIYTPQGWGVGSGAVGDPVAFTILSALVDSSPFDPTFGTGQLVVGDPGLGADATAQACSPGSHGAVWVTTVKGRIGTFPLRFYVDQTTGPDTSLGAYRITACLPSPYLPVAQGGAPNGMQVSELSLEATLANPSSVGTYGWRVLVTPYVYGTATPDAANTFEVRTRVLFPYTLTLHAAYQPRTQTLVLSGRALALGKPRSGVKVGLFAEWASTPADTLTATIFKDLRTRSDGSFRLSEPRRRILQSDQAAVLRIDAFADAVPGACTTPTTAPGGCVGDSISPPITPAFPGLKVTIPAVRSHG